MHQVLNFSRTKLELETHVMQALIFIKINNLSNLMLTRQIIIISPIYMQKIYIRMQKYTCAKLHTCV